MKTSVFIVMGRPIGKARPRVTRRGTFTPKATREYEEKVRAAWECKGAIRFDDDARIRAEIEAAFPYPAGTSKKRRAQRRWRPSRPDVDNISKIILDALNGYAYKDDAQVVSLNVDKVYDDGNGYVSVALKQIEEEEVDFDNRGGARYFAFLSSRPAR